MTAERVIMRFAAIGALLVLATAARGQDMPLSQILIPGEAWREVKLPAGKATLLAADGKGQVYVADSDRKGIFRLGLSPAARFARSSSAVRGLCAGSDN